MQHLLRDAARQRVEHGVDVLALGQQLARTCQLDGAPVVGLPVAGPGSAAPLRAGRASATKLCTPASMMASACADGGVAFVARGLHDGERSSTSRGTHRRAAATSGSMSRGTARSTMRIGRRLRAFMARSTAPRPIIGNVLAVQEMTTSNSGRRVGRSVRRMECALKCAASASPRSRVRLAMVIAFGCGPRDGSHQRDHVAGTDEEHLDRGRFSNNCDASCTIAAAMLMVCMPISVQVRTSLATANERWNNWCSVVPSVPAVSASRTACLNWPRICGSPSTIERQAAGDRKVCRAARRPPHVGVALQVRYRHPPVRRATRGGARPVRSRIDASLPT